MRSIKGLLVMLICLICASCQPISKPETPPVLEPIDPNDIISSNIPYDEPADSLENLTEEQILDLSGLKTAFDEVGTNYVSTTKVFFNKLAVSRYNIIFTKNFRCQQTTVYNEKYIYKYTNDATINKGTFNYNENLCTVELNGETVEERLNSNINKNAIKLLYRNSSVNEHYLTLSNFRSVYDNVDTTECYLPLSEFNSLYVDNYGPTKKVTIYSGDVNKDYKGWTRISENKYMCDRDDVIEHFVAVCAPTYPINDGMYMTYTHVTVEVDPTTDVALRIRVYASSTQIGKLINSHTEKDKPNWYLLFAEALISNVGNAKVEAFEKLYN